MAITALKDGRVIYVQTVKGIRETITVYKNGGTSIQVEKING